MLSFASSNQLPPCSSVSVAVEEDYFIFFSREGERSRVERRVEKNAGYSEEIGTNVSSEYVIPQIVVMELMFLRRIHVTTKEELERLMMREL